MRLFLPSLVVALTVLAFFPAFGADWLQWDDDRNFTTNYPWRGLEWANLEWMVTTFHMGPYQPLSWFTLGLDYSVWGLDARGFHATNILIHALAALAAWFVARRTFAIAIPRARATNIDLAAAFAAIVFGAHPLRCESVCWITERRDVLAGLFFVLAFGAWLRFATAAPRSGRRWYFVALALFLLSLSAKAATLTFPFVLLVLDAWPLRRASNWAAWRARLVEKLPFLVLSIGFGVLALKGQAEQHSALKSLSELGVPSRLALLAYSVAFYPWKMLWPSGLIPIYELPIVFDPFEPRFLACAAVVLGITLGLFAWRRRAPAPLVAWMAYALLLAPVSGLAQAGGQLAADRYSYFSCVPFALLAGGTLLLCIERRPTPRIVALVACALVVLSLVGSTIGQSRVWRNSAALWSWTLSVDPTNLNALQNLGSVRMQQGANADDPSERKAGFDEARAHFQRAIDSASSPACWVNLGLVTMLAAEGDAQTIQRELERALEQVDHGIAIGRDNGGVLPEWRLHRGVVLLRLGRTREAFEELSTFVELEPESPQGRRMLSLALGDLAAQARADGRIEEAARRTGEAAEELVNALAFDPDDGVLWMRLGQLYARDERKNESRAAFEQAIEVQSKKLGARSASDPIVLDARRAIEELGTTR